MPATTTTWALMMTHAKWPPASQGW